MTPLEESVWVHNARIEAGLSDGARKLCFRSSSIHFKFKSILDLAILYLH